MREIPLHTLSCVDTCVPSSIVCKVKSISGTGFFSVTARSICAILIESPSSEAQSAKFCVLRDRICDRWCLPLRGRLLWRGLSRTAGLRTRPSNTLGERQTKGLWDSQPGTIDVSDVERRDSVERKIAEGPAERGEWPKGWRELETNFLAAAETDM